MFAQFDEGWVVKVAMPPITINLENVRARMPRGRQSGEPTSELIAEARLPGHANAGEPRPLNGVWYAVEYFPNAGRGRFRIGERQDPPADWFVWRAQQTRYGHQRATWFLESPPGIRRAMHEQAKEFPCAFKPRPSCVCEECTRRRAAGEPLLHPDE